MEMSINEMRAPTTSQLLLRFLREDDVGKKFVRIEPHDEGYGFPHDWSYTPAAGSSPSVIERIEKVAPRLKAYNNDGSMTFTGCHVESDFSLYDFSVKKSWNDGHWMPVEKYVELLRS